MPSLAYINGEWSAPELARVPLWDRGFLFGDSVYEVMRVYQGRAWLEQSHFDRLARSLAAVRICGIDLDVLRKTTRQTLERSGLVEATVYIQITRGVAPRKHAFPRPGVPPTVVIVAMPYDDGPCTALRESGVSVISVRDQRWGRCDIKSTNLLANVLANEDAHEAGAYEAVLFDREGFVTESTHSSLLWVRDGYAAGSPEGSEILPGTTRHLVCRLMEEQSLPFREERIDLATLQAADEVILFGTTIEVLPVTQVDSIKIGDGSVGKVSRRLQQAYSKSIDRWLNTTAEQVF